MSSLSPAIARTVCTAILATLFAAPLAHAGLPEDLAPAIVLTPASLTVTEGGSVATYSVHLTLPPAGLSLDVAVASTAGQVLLKGPNDPAFASSTVLTFTPLDFGTNQEVQVQAIDDAAIDGIRVDAVTHTPASGDLLYGGKSATLAATAKDNDHGFRLVPSGGSTTVIEGTASDTFEVVLGSAPTANVRVRLAPEAPLSISPGVTSFEFTPADWSPRTFTVNAPDNPVAQGSLGRNVHVTTTSTDASYNALFADLPVTITDNDQASLRLTQGGTPLANSASVGTLTEGGATTYQVALTSQPSAAVTVTVAPNSGRASVSPGALTFGAGNWSIPQTLTVSANNDPVDQGSDTTPAIVALVHHAASADTLYNALADRLLGVGVLDNDQAGIRLFQGATELPATAAALTGTALEGGAPLQYQVKLTTQPTAPFTLAVTASEPAAATLTPATLSFDATNWNTLQAVTVAAVSNAVDNGPASRPVTLSHRASAAEPVYAALADRTLTVNVGDDDTAAILRTSAEASPSVSEAGDTYAYALHLGSQPLAPVTVAPTSSPAGLVFTPASLTFTPADWQTDKAITVSVANDATPGFPRTPTLDHAVATTDTLYAAAGAKPAALTVQVLDDDGILVLTPATVQPTEGGTATFLVHVLAQPNGAGPNSDVTVNLELPGGGQFTATPATLTFKPTDTSPGSAAHQGRTPCTSEPLDSSDCQWDHNRTVTVTATDDSDIDGTVWGNLTLRTASSLPAYSGQASRVLVGAVDNDAPGLVFSVPSLPVTEGGSASYTVRLAAAPKATVRVALAGPGDAQANVAALTFGPGNWSTPKPVTVNVPRDFVDKGATYGASIVHTATSTDTLYNIAGTLAVTVTDQDAWGYQFAATGQTGLLPNVLPTPATTEGASAAYSVKLTSKPVANVAVGISSGAGAIATPSTLTFTPGNWNTAQTVTVAVAANGVDQTPTGTTYEILVAHAVSGDPLYATIPGPVHVTITEDDGVGITLSATGAGTVVQEGGATDTLTVVLASQPTGTVTVNLPAPSGITTSPSSLSFTPAAWNVPQTVTVAAVNDTDPEFQQTVTLTATGVSGDALYSGLTASASVTVLDNDGVLELGNATGLAVSEGGQTATYTVHLIEAPAAPVTVNVTSTDSRLRFNGMAHATLTFLPADTSITNPFKDRMTPCPDTEPLDDVNCRWDNPQSITVSVGGADTTPQGTLLSVIAHAVNSAGDSRYNNTPSPPVLVSVADNDPGVFVVQSGGSTAVAEGGAADAYTLALSMPPQSETVTVALTHDSRISVSPAEIVFGTDNWNEAQVVTVVAVDDHIDQANVVASPIHHQVTGDVFNGLSVPDLAVTVTDDDSADFVLQQSGGSTTVTEGGPADTYTVVLRTQPTANVQVALSPGSGLTTTPGALTFTPTNWQGPQTVMVSAVDDSVAQGNRAVTIHHALTSSDPAYHGTVADLAVAVLDNDAVGVMVVQSGGSTSVKENTLTDSFTVRLASQPGQSVTVTLAPDAGLGVSANPLTFTTANWNTPQSVTVAGINDDVAQGTRTLAIAFSIASADAAYQGLPVPSLPVTLVDDDNAGVVFGQSASVLAVTEGGPNSVYAFRLQSQPTANVVVQISADAQLTLGRSSLTFTPSNWQAYQGVPVTAVDDAVAEGTHTGVVAHTSTSTDPLYNGMAIPNVTATITDND
ncbi:MAG: beta strand repeat-containing protein [Thermoplasmatota archaeon]